MATRNDLRGSVAWHGSPYGQVCHVPAEDFVVLRWFQYELVLALSLSPPKLSVMKKETPCTSNFFSCSEGRNSHMSLEGSWGRGVGYSGI